MQLSMVLARQCPPLPSEASSPQLQLTRRSEVERELKDNCAIPNADQTPPVASTIPPLCQQCVVLPSGE